METVEYKQKLKSIGTSTHSRYNNNTLIEDSGIVFRSTYIITPVQINTMDIYHTVLVSEVGRLDLISMKYYNTPLLYWKIAETNGIVDPIGEIVIGMVLRIPSKL